MAQNPQEYHYVAYIDEAGDDGLKAVKPLSKPGASEWLILSAVVIRAENQAEVASWVNAIKAEFKNHQRSDIHFTGLNPAKKARACAMMAELDARYFVVISNKKNMEGYENPFAGKIPSSNWFYCWMTRLLLERVTKFVNDRSIEDHGEPRKLRIEYSARGGLRYSQMSAYYEWMKLKKHNPYLPWGRLCRDVMHQDLLHVYPHLEREGLQLADVVASPFFKACDKHDTGACDPTFAKLLKPRMGREPNKKRGQISGFGVKLMPSMRKAKLDRDQSDIFKFYGYPSQWWCPEAFND
jgi:hypothetical protein